MKMRYNILLIVAMVAFTVVACTQDEGVIDFKSDRNTIEVGAYGGVEKVRISSDDEWVALVGIQQNGEPNPWITVSPANGRGSVTCDFIIDSALTINPRSAVVTIENVATKKRQHITINQKGFDYSVEIDKTKADIKRYADYGERYFDVTVRSNFDFKIDIPDSEKHWLSYTGGLTMQLPVAHQFLPVGTGLSKLLNIMALMVITLRFAIIRSFLQLMDT